MVKIKEQSGPKRERKKSDSNRKRKQQPNRKKSGTVPIKNESFFKDAFKALGYRLTSEKLFCISILSIVLFLVSSNVSTILSVVGITSSNMFEPDPVKVGGFWIDLDCLANNTPLLTQQSNINCKLSAKYDGPNIIIEELPVHIKTFSVYEGIKPEWFCFARVRNITSSSYSNKVLCETELGSFKPPASGKYRFSLFFIGDFQIKDSITSEVKWISYANKSGKYNYTDLAVLSESEAGNMQMAKYTLILAVFAVIIPALFQIRSFLREK